MLDEVLTTSRSDLLVKARKKPDGTWDCPGRTIFRDICKILCLPWNQSVFFLEKIKMVDLLKANEVNIGPFGLEALKRYEATDTETSAEPLKNMERNKSL